jgi:hypothetical protein
VATATQNSVERIVKGLAELKLGIVRKIKREAFEAEIEQKSHHACACPGAASVSAVAGVLLPGPLHKLEETARCLKLSAL